MYGDKTVQVKLNNKVINQTGVGATGAVGFTFSPMEGKANHSIFELSFKASQGTFGVQLHDPGPRFGCDVLETEPTTFIGNADTGGGLSVTPSSIEAFTDAWNKLPDLMFFQTTTSTTTQPDINWCWAGNPKKPCRQMPGPRSSDFTNVNWKDHQGVEIINPKQKTKHVCDGAFTGFFKGDALAGYYPFGASTESDHNEREWSNTQPAIGRYTNAYFEYDGSHLHILNDWVYNAAQAVLPNCYNLFNAFTGSGRERWELKVYGSGVVSVQLNGKSVLQTNGIANATGAIGFTCSPMHEQANHTIFEISFKASPGSFVRST